MGLNKLNVNFEILEANEIYERIIHTSGADMCLYRSNNGGLNVDLSFLDKEGNEDLKFYSNKNNMLVYVITVQHIGKI